MGAHNRTRAATLAEVAARAGVSRTTASRVLNEHPGVREPARQRVLAAMDELGYVPDRLARGLRQGTTGIIGLLIPQPAATVFSDTYFATLVSAVVRAGQRRGLVVAMILVDAADAAAPPGGPDPGGRVGLAADVRLLDGALVAASVDDAAIATSLAAQGVAVVVIGDLGLDDVDSVDVDNERGSELAVRHLLATGRRRFVVVEGPATNASARARGNAARQAIADGDATLVRSVAATAFSLRGGRDAMQEVLRTVARDGFDAVVAGSDAIAAGLQSVLDDHALRVPDDVALVGFDDLPPARSAVPPLTTIHQPIATVADHAMGRLLELVGTTDEAPRREVLPVHLVTRAST